MAEHGVSDDGYEMKRHAQTDQRQRDAAHAYTILRLGPN